MFRNFLSRTTNQRIRAASRAGFSARFQAEQLEARRVLSASTCEVPGDVAGPETPAAIGLLLPAVQKVREAASKVEELTLAHRDDHAQAGLLLPAVQKVREAASRSGHDCQDQVQDRDNNENEKIGLLLPAVQKVREAAARTTMELKTDQANDNAMIGLLLPAVQKVRGAAGR